jgi:hypothetical protein
MGDYATEARENGPPRLGGYFRERAHTRLGNQ